MESQKKNKEEFYKLANHIIFYLVVKYNVIFKSDEIFFTADSLKLNQKNESFIAYGSPIKIKFYDGFEFIEGEAEKVEIDTELLKLSRNVSIIKSGNKINSENLTIKLSNDKS